MNLLKILGSFLKDAFSEEGKGSFSRLAQGAIVLSVISWVTYVVLKTKAIPDLTGPSLFLGAGAASQYGVNKVTAIFNKDKSDQPNQ